MSLQDTIFDISVALEGKPECKLFDELVERFTVLETTKYQLCPKCNGQGTVSKPPWVAGDVQKWASSSTSFVCDVCQGSKILVVRN